MTNTNETVDLWGDIVAEPSRLPLNVLREQAKLLEEKTKGVLTANIKSQGIRENSALALASIFNKNVPHNSYFKCTFSIEAPGLNYSYRLFTFYQPIEIFPITFDISEFQDEESKIIAANEEEFIEVLRKILQSPKTEKIINALLSQSLALA